MTPLLAQRLRADRSFERMYRRYAADVYHYALGVARNPSDAEDIAQTTFMNAYRAFQRGERPRAPKNWLLTIAHNVLRQRFRQSARRPDEVALDDSVAAAVPDEPAYSAAEIRRALGEIAFSQRAALVLRELEGRSYAEIAEILGLSVGAVEALIFRARRALREQLEGSLTCHEAELAISRQLDARLSRAEKSTLRAHLRTCEECASFARSQRAQRAALRGLAAIPLPASLTSLFGGGGAAVGGAVATKAAAVTAVGLLVAGGTIETAKRVRSDGRAPSATEQASRTAASPARTQKAAGSEISAPSRVVEPRVAAAERRAATPRGRAAKRSGGAAQAENASAKRATPVRARGRVAAPGQAKAKQRAGATVAPKAKTAESKPSRVQRGRSQSRSQPERRSNAATRGAPPPRERRGTPALKGKEVRDRPPAQADPVTITVPGTEIAIPTPIPKPKKR